MKLNNKVAVITGGASGIGKRTALLFAEEGAIIAICDINMDAMRKFSELFTKNNYAHATYQLDVSNYSDTISTFEKIASKFGKIDILINNAGITADAQLKNMSEEQFDSVIGVNLKGVFNCTKAVSKIMIKQGSGVILTPSSVVGIYGNFGQTNYTASKFGVIGMTKTWARELSPKGIRVNALAPGFIRTPMTEKMPQEILEMMREKTPLKRLGEDIDVAKAYLFLASDDASFITGAVLPVDGGLVL